MTVPFDYLPFRSLAAYGHHEACAHKYFCSEDAETDLGAAAYRAWFDNFWVVFCHHRWVQHLYGERPFQEFKQGNFFGRIRVTDSSEVWARQKQLCLSAVRFVEERFLLPKDPWENLDFIRHEAEIRASGIDYQEVLKVLAEYGINECRINWKDIFQVEECDIRDEFRWYVDKLSRTQSA